MRGLKKALVVLSCSFPGLLAATSYSLKPLEIEEVGFWFQSVENLFAFQAWESGLFPALKDSQEDAHRQFHSIVMSLHEQNAFEEWKQNNYVFFVMWESEVAGFFWYSTQIEELAGENNGNGVLTHVFVEAIELSPEYRGKGMGTKILRDLEVKSKSKNFGFIRLHLFTSNQAALKFYQKLGFFIEAQDSYSIYMRKNIDFFNHKSGS